MFRNIVKLFYKLVRENFNLTSILIHLLSTHYPDPHGTQSDYLNTNGAIYARMKVFRDILATF